MELSTVTWVVETKPALVARSLPGVLWLVLNPEEKFSVGFWADWTPFRRLVRH